MSHSLPRFWVEHILEYVGVCSLKMSPLGRAALNVGSGLLLRAEPN